jgi:hypothetical protein
MLYLLLLSKKETQINNTKFSPPIKFFQMTSILNKCLVLRYEERRGRRRRRKKRTQY